MAKNDRGIVTGTPVTYKIPAPPGGVQMETFIPWTLVKRGVRRQVITPIDAPEHFQREAVVERSARKEAKDSPLMRALGLAHYWQRLLDEGKYRSLTEIASLEGLDLAQVSRITQLSDLAPALIETCLVLRHPTYTLERMSRRRQPTVLEKAVGRTATCNHLNLACQTPNPPSHNSIPESTNSPYI